MPTGDELNEEGSSDGQDDDLEDAEFPLTLDEVDDDEDEVREKGDGEEDELGRTIDSPGNSANRGDDLLGRTIDSPGRCGSDWERASAAGEPLGPTLDSPPERGDRPHGPGDTLIISPRRIADAFGFLVVRSGSRQHDIHRLDHLRVVLGRDRTAEIFIDDPYASGQHASIRCEAEGEDARAEFILRDLDSPNGTEVNGESVIAPHLLVDGDVIRIGETELVFKRL